MIGSPQHATAKWLADLLAPVMLKYSEHTIKDGFAFADSVKELRVTQSAHMCSFDI